MMNNTMGLVDHTSVLPVGTLQRRNNRGIPTSFEIAGLFESNYSFILHAAGVGWAVREEEILKSENELLIDEVSKYLRPENLFPGYALPL